MLQWTLHAYQLVERDFLPGIIQSHLVTERNIEPEHAPVICTILLLCFRGLLILVGPLCLLDLPLVLLLVLFVDLLLRHVFLCVAVIIRYSTCSLSVFTVLLTVTFLLLCSRVAIGSVRLLIAAVTRRLRRWIG